jgi:hypothetical protein
MPTLLSEVDRSTQARRRNSLAAGAKRRLIVVTGNLSSRRSRQGGTATIHGPEPLESRQLLSASIDSAGWTVVAPPAGARVIYVSSSQGNDSNSGMSPSAPVQSIARGVSLLRNNSADEMLLMRGDTWHASLGFWKLSGLSPQDPSLIGAYGSGARPTLATGNSDALQAAGVPIKNLDIIGIHMYPNARRGGGPDGISIDSKLSNLLIEDCDIEGYHDNIVIDTYFGRISNVTIRRSIVSNAWSGNGSHSEGVFLDGVNGITLQDDVFDHDGWEDALGGWATIFNHDVYVTAACSGLVATDNIFADASNFGLEARCGGTIEDNLFYDDADGLEFGLVDGSPVTPGGVSGSVIGNVFIGSHAIGVATYGNGLMLGNINGKGVVVSDNLFDDNSVGEVPAIELEVGSANSNFNSAVGLNNVTITGNVINHWYEAIWVQGGLRPGGKGPYAINNVQISGNQFSDIQVQSVGQIYPGESTFSANAARGFPNPGLSLASYASTLGVGDSDTAFLTAAAAQSSTNWSSSLSAAAITHYLLAGFGLGTGAPTGPVTGPVPTPTPTPTPTPAPTSTISLQELIGYAMQESASNRTVAANSTLPGAVRNTFAMETLGTSHVVYYSFTVNGVTLYAAHYDIDGRTRVDCRVSAAGQLLGKLTLTGAAAIADRAAAAAGT